MSIICVEEEKRIFEALQDVFASERERFNMGRSDVVGVEYFQCRANRF